MMSGDSLDTRAAALRAAFDDAFRPAPAAGRAALDPVLAIRLAGHPYALRAADVTGVLVDRRITALPSAAPNLRGLVGIRSAIVAVYDLAGLLGHQVSASPRWLITAAAAPIALAVEQFEGLAHVAPDRLTVADGSAFFAGTITVAGTTRPLIALGAVLEGLLGGLPPNRVERNNRS